LNGKLTYPQPKREEEMETGELSQPSFLDHPIEIKDEVQEEMETGNAQEEPRLGDGNPNPPQEPTSDWSDNEEDRVPNIPDRAWNDRDSEDHPREGAEVTTEERRSEESEAPQSDPLDLRTNEVEYLGSVIRFPPSPYEAGRQRRLRWLDQMVDFYEDLIDQAIQMTREGASVERIGNLLSYRIRNPPRF
jgi:hypothetical protein